MDPEEKPEESGRISLHRLRILEALEEEPEVRQLDLAMRLGVALGTVNWHLKRLAAKGCIQVKKIGRWRWRYILTPKGMAEKARLTRAYIEQSMRLYRETRERARQLLGEVKRAGYTQVRIEGENELADVCRLTCLEQGLKVVDSASSASEDKARVPILRVEGRELSLEWPGGEVTPDREGRSWQNGPIAIGDFWTTSLRPGSAMHRRDSRQGVGAIERGSKGDHDSSDVEIADLKVAQE